MFIIEDPLKETMKYKDIQISPSKNLLQSHPNVEAMVVGVSHILNDEYPFAFVTEVPDSKDTSNFITKDNIWKGIEKPISLKYTNIGKLLLDRMKAKPDFVGQIDVVTEETYTFAEMFDRTVKCALWLRQQGIKANDVVALCSSNIMDSFAPIYASFSLAAIITSWNTAMDIREARFFMKLSSAKIIFTEESLVDMLIEAANLENHDIKIVVFGNTSNAIPFSKVLQDHRKCDVDNFECTSVNNVYDTAIIAYSSGTTGLPKGVQISHYACLYAVSSENLGVCNIPLWMTSYFWITGLQLTLNSTINYCKRLLYPKFDEEMMCKIIEKYKVTWLFLSPSMANRTLKSGYPKKYDLSSVEIIFITGGIFNVESQRMLKENLINAMIIQIYGMTEICGSITVKMPYHKPESIGMVSKNVQIKIIDVETGNILGPNKTGELLVKSLTMTKGYYNNPQATKDAIDDDGWFHSGDLTYYDEKGQFFFVDRLKETIKYRGYHVSPCEIETLLQTHPDVVEAAVVGVPNLQDDERPIAFVVKVSGSKVTERELQELVAKNMTERNHLHAGVIFLEKMPYTPSEKISRKELKVIAKNHFCK
ncbi:4-coumarate--CoA ligase 1-like [Vespula squamosa]|uniref:4-coumarate--CoA ligase 1-like n=1 Tax=Vespula squamosa TaxID=30214 RepID=A0ABD2B9M3_VESSQ